MAAPVPQNSPRALSLLASQGARVEPDGDGGWNVIDAGGKVLNWNAWDNNGLQLNGGNLLLGTSTDAGGGNCYAGGGSFFYVNEFHATTLFGDGSNLTGIPEAAVTGLVADLGGKATATALSSHTTATGAAVHGLGTASTHAHTDYDPAGAALAATAADTRPPRVVQQQAVSVAAGTSLDLLNVTGAGNVDLVQLAFDSTVPQAFLDSTISVYIDGESSPSISMPLGLWQLWYGGAVASERSDLFSVDALSIDMLSSGGYTSGGYRRIFIPYTTACRIVYNNTSGAAATIWYQVQYRVGAPPASATNGRRRRLRVAYTPAFTAVAQYATRDWINVTGVRGQAEGIMFFAVGNDADPANRTTFLEGDVTISVDGTQVQHWGGTEDFFGNHAYADNFHVKTNQWGMVDKSPTNATPDGTAFVGAYRLYSRVPGDDLTFESALQITWANGQAGQSSGSSGTTSIAVAVFYYTDS